MDMDKLELLNQAEMAEQAGRYDDMRGYMNRLVKLGEELSNQEKILFIFSYEHSINEKLSSLSVLSSIELKVKEDQLKHRLAIQYKQKVVFEIKGLYLDMLEILDDILVDGTSDAETKANYLILKLQYMIKLAEFVDEEMENSIKEEGKRIADIVNGLIGEVPENIVLRLDFEWVFCVFQHEVLEERELSCERLKTMYDEALIYRKDVNGCTKDLDEAVMNIRKTLRLWNVSVKTEEVVSGKKNKASLTRRVRRNRRCTIRYLDYLTTVKTAIKKKGIRKGDGYDLRSKKKGPKSKS